MKRFIKWLTRPKITVYLKSGAEIRIRRLCYAHCNIQLEYDLLSGEKLGLMYNPIERAAVDCRKWYQLWP